MLYEGGGDGPPDIEDMVESMAKALDLGNEVSVTL